MSTTRKVRLNKLKLSVPSRGAVDIRTYLVGVVYEGLEIEVIIPVKHLRDDVDTYSEQAEAFFREAADEIAEYRRIEAAKNNS